MVKLKQGKLKLIMSFRTSEGDDYGN